MFRSSRIIKIVGLVISFSLGLAQLSMTATAAELTKVTIVYSTSNQDVSYQPYGAYAQQVGWYKEDGLDVTIQTAPNNGQVTQLLLTGQADFGMLGPDPILLAAEKEPLPIKMVYMIVRKMIFAAAIRPDGKVNNFGDLKGKVIGMPSLSSQLIPFVNSRLNEFGGSVENAKIVDLGYGVASMDALKKGTIDAFIAWPGLFAAFQNAGYDFKILPDAPWQKDFYGIGLAARTDYIEKNPDVVAKIGRGLARSTVLMQTDPDALIKSFWKSYPTKAPLPGADMQKALENERNVMLATASQMRADELPADFAWGSQDLATWQRHLDRLKATGLIAKDVQLNPAEYFTNDFTTRYNN